MWKKHSKDSLDEIIDLAFKGIFLQKALKYIIIGAIGIGGIILADKCGHKTNSSKAIYADPQQVSIYLKDIDSNGHQETVIQYKDKSYLLMIGKDGKPECREYKVDPTKISIQ